MDIEDKINETVETLRLLRDYEPSIIIVNTEVRKQIIMSHFNNKNIIEMEDEFKKTHFYMGIHFIGSDSINKDDVLVY